MMRTIARAVRLGTIPPLVLATPVLAAERAWIAPAGGAFDDAMNWSDGAVPGPTDTARFALPAAYPVFVDDPAHVDRGLFDLGIVTLLVAPEAELEIGNPFFTTPGLAVGTLDGAIGSLTIGAGATRAAYATVGGDGGLGMLDVVGADTALTLGAELRVGFLGTGLLTIGDGAEVSTARAVLAQSGADYASALVEGAGSRWDADGALVVGDRGVAHLEIRDGASVTSTTAVIAQNTGGQGDVIVDGAAWTIDGPIDVGMSGRGTLTLEHGATLVSRDFAVLGTFPADDESAGGDGTVTIGTESTWSIESGFFGGHLHVGLFGTGTLRLEHGGRVRLDGDLDVAPYAEAKEALVVELSSDDDHALAPAIDAGGIACGEVTVRLADGYAPSIGARFHLARAARWQELTVVLPSPPPGTVWGVTDEVNDLAVFVVPVSCAVDVLSDCDENGIDDTCEVALGVALDCNDDGVPDHCGLLEMDCNGNGIPDDCDLAAGATDCNANGVIDSCEFIPQDAPLLPPGSAAAFGFDVAASGDTLVVGAPQTGANGVAHVYRRVGTSWFHEATLVPDAVPDGSEFGVAVAVDGDRIVVGAREFVGPGGTGAAFLFERTDGAWAQTYRFEPEDGDAQRFGDGVAIDGPVVAIGMIEEGVGFVLAYRETASGWTRELTYSMQIGGFAIAGPGVDLAGGVLAAGFRTSGNSGRAAILRHDGVEWKLERLLLPPFPNDGTSFGSLITGVPVSTDGARVVVGGEHANRDVAFVLRADGDAWIDEAIVTPPLVLHDFPAYGRSVHIDGDELISGSPVSGYSAARIYRHRLVDGQWTPEEILYPADAQHDDVGVAIAVSGDRIFAGSRIAWKVRLFSAGDADCNANGMPDGCEILAGTSADANANGIPDECEPSCPADLDDSGGVEFRDLVALLAAWGPCGACPADLDANGAVAFPDLLLLLEAWGPCP